MFLLSRAQSDVPALWRRRSLSTLRAVCAASLAVLTACGGGGDSGGGTQPTPASISLSVGNAALTIGRGSSATSTVTVARTNFTGALSLATSTPPNGVTVSFDPPSLGAGASSSVATIAVGPTTAPGTYSISVTASGNGVSSATGTIAVTVPSPSITLAAGAATATMVQGTNTTVALSITRAGGYTDAVSLAASGLPAGVTASFAPASIASGSTTSTLTLTASATATVGTAPIVITASGTGITAQTTTVSLTVTAAPTPAITLTAGAGTASVVQGLNTTVALSITRSGGFAGAVGVAVTGLPAGVTATFAPASIPTGSTTSTLTLAAASNATVGTAPITISASAPGVSTQTATVNLTVTAGATPTIALAAAPAALSLQAGATGTSTIAITRAGGFTGDVALAVTGAPAGVAATLVPTTVAGASTSSVLSLIVGANTLPGQYNLTVTGSGTGVANATTTVALTVTAVPAIAITVAPTTVNATAGGSVTGTITLARTNFTGDVALAASGLPTGVTATFAPATLTGATATSVVTLSVAAGTAPSTGTVTLTASGTGVSSATASLGLSIGSAPSISLSANPATTALTAGGTTTSVITLARTNFTGDVSLTASGLPTGVTAAFAPATLTGSTLTTTLTLSAGAGAALGAATVTVTASGTGVANATTSVGVTVSAAPTIGIVAAPSSVTFAAGGSATSTITLTRTNFTGTVSLAAGNLPAGVSAAFSQPTLSGATLTSTLTLSANSGAAASTGSVTVTASGTGVSNATAAVGVTLTGGGGGGGTGNVNLRFCDVASLPTLVAFRSGTSGAWMRATPGANNTYSFTITGVGGMAWAFTEGPNESTVIVQYGTAAELGAYSSTRCESTRGKSLTGTFVGVGPTQTATVSLGTAFSPPGFTPGTSSFSLTDVPDGPQDLLAWRNNLNLVSFSATPDRGVLRRNVNYPAGSIIPPVDFGGSDSFTPATATVTVNNVPAGAQQLSVLANVLTTNGQLIGFGGLPSATVATTGTVYGLPAALTQPTDFHAVTAAATISAGTIFEIRTVSQLNRNLANRTLDLGPSLVLPTFTTVTTVPYARVRAQGTFQAEYGEQINGSFSQTVGTTNRSWTVSASRGYFGNSGSYDFELPDLSGVAGWSNSFGLVAGTPVEVFAQAYSYNLFAPSVEGAVVRTVLRGGPYTP